MTTCPFCVRITAGDTRWADDDVAAFPDGYPLNPGHSLVVPTQHVADLNELSAGTRRRLWELVDVVREALAEEFQPDGFNIGVNLGAAAGQTVGHVHIHVIPRYAGDVDDPRGGVRWVIPQRADYWNDHTTP